MKGWIKLHRKLLEWEWADNPIVFHLFIHLLLSANHKEKLWRGNKVKKGQFITGLYSLSEQTGISIQSLRTALKKLELTKEITRKSTNKFSIITIVKWEQYQVLEQELTINQQTTNKQLTTTNNDNNVKNNKSNINVLNKSNTNSVSKDTAGIIEIFDIFKKINPVINYGHKTNRKVATELIKKFGLDETKRLTAYAVSVQGKNYAPTITTPYQLREKLAQLKIYHDKNNKSKYKSI